ncbi:uncharacterized protein LOC112501923 [Cynara cardunculus var. scolymus]|uniref:Uncharacterized protein n=1 Tax=Cynara cardunculus var. scolymus TaxID=59895 RepID=A0A103YGV4_CYNCS|nr:uncharacterized protein LOC112501923 [Cynara cardunculus var. scolymus]KVI08862.1 hypothetical protein Ccrd_012763 [Cynara cardunculus var. scolymus]
MATMQKFKMLATQCAVAGSPTRSPSTSPVIHLRRRKTLRMLLSRGGGGTRRLPPTNEFVDRRGSDVDSSEDEKDSGARRKLKDLFVSSSSPPPPSTLGESGRDGGEETNRWSGDDADLIGRRGGSRGLRALPGTLRQRLLRRAWRPVLVTIPE